MELTRGHGASPEGDLAARSSLRALLTVAGLAATCNSNQYRDTSQADVQELV